MAFDLKKISFHFEAPNERDYVKKLLQQIEKEYKSIYKIATGDSIKENFDIEKALTDLENDPKFSEVRKIHYRDLISVRFNNFRIENITGVVSGNGKYSTLRFFNYAQWPKFSTTYLGFASP